VSQRQLSDAELVRYLYTHSTVTAPHIAKTFNVDPKTASYHLEKLVKLGLAAKQERSYGSKYMLKPELTKIPARFYIQLALTYTPFILGVILLLNTYYIASSLFLLLSSAVGIISTYQQLSHYRKGRLEEILMVLRKTCGHDVRKQT